MTTTTQAAPATAPRPDDRLDWLCDTIPRNRFLPVPRPEDIFVGDGDYLPIGAEFLKLFVRMGGLASNERVLDLGCGIGRMAVPLTQYLADGTYDGVDIVASGIAWCRRNVTSRYPNFRFHHLDLAHPLYNPDGAGDTTSVTLPFPERAFDFVIMTSVVTHLPIAEVRAYAREIRRVMAPGGRLFMTAFMLNGPARAGLVAGGGALPFDGASTASEQYAHPDTPTAAVAFDENLLLSVFLNHALRRRRPAVYGRWSGRASPGPSFQDINILEIDPEGARP